MSVFQGICPMAVTEHMLSDIGACNLVQMCGRCVTKQPGVQLFIDPDPISRGAEDILQCPLGDALFAL